MKNPGAQKNQLAWDFLVEHKKKVYLSFLISFFLALSSCLLAYLVGPSLSYVIQVRQETYELSELLGPYLAQLFSFSEISASQLYDTLVFSLIFLASLKAVSSLSFSFLWEFLGGRSAHSLRKRLFKSYLEASPFAKRAFEEKGFEKNLATLMSKDTKSFQEYLVNVWGGISRELVQVCFFSCGLVFLSPLLFFVFFLCLLPVFLFLGKLGKKLKVRSSEAVESYSLLTEWVQDRFLGMETIKSRRTEAYEVRKMKEFSSELFQKDYRHAYTQSRAGPLLEFAGVCSLTLIVFVALWMIQKGFITSSVVLSFCTLLAILGQSLKKLGQYFSLRKTYSASLERVSYYLSLCTSEKAKGFPKILNLSPEISAHTALVCSQISFLYPDSEKWALKDFSFSFKKGTFYCLAGPSGSGKSTLLKCLLGFLPYKRGEARYGRGVSSFSQIAYLPQKVQLPPVTVGECVSYPSEEIDKKKLSFAFGQAGMRDFVESLPEGSSTLVGDSIETGFSGGQNQKLLLARLFYHKPALILIDEGTSSLDASSEEFVCENLKKLVKSSFSTVIFVSHSHQVMKYADELLHIS